MRIFRNNLIVFLIALAAVAWSLLIWGIGIEIDKYFDVKPAIEAIEQVQEHSTKVIVEMPDLLARFDNNLTNTGRNYGGSGTFTAGFGYRALKPSNLTSENGILITQSDNLQYTRGSKTQNNESIVYENFDPHQGTLEFWVRPNWDGDDGNAYNIFNSTIVGSFIFQLAKQTNNYLRFYVYDGSDHTLNLGNTSSWTAGTWHHIVLTWDADGGTNNVVLYDNGTANTGTMAFTPKTQETTFSIGNTKGTYTFNGTIAGRILNRPLTSSEVSDLYNSGSGSTDTFTVTPDTVWMGTYSDSDTDAVFQHRGQEVTSTTTTSITLNEAVGSRSWADNDRVVIYDGTGYKKEALINDASIATTDTSFNVDDGAGGAVTDLDKVGRSLDFDATYYAQAANNTIHDITTQDIGISAWVRVDSGAGAAHFLSKRTTNAGYAFYMTSGGIVGLYIKDGDGDTYGILGNTDIRDNKWHYIAAIIDKSDAANAKVYLDGYEDGTTNKTGTLANVGDISSTEKLTLGASPDLSNKFDGQIRDVILAYPTDIMAAGEMGASGKILELATKPRDMTVVNSEDYWTLNDNAASTTVTGAVNNLTASANTNTFSTQEAFISKNLIVDAGMENGGIGGWDIDAVTTAKDSSAKFDTQSIKLTSSGIGQEITQSFTVAEGENYFFRVWYKVNSGDAATIKLDKSGNELVVWSSLSSTTWDFVETSAKVPTGWGTTLRVMLRANSNTDVARFDQISILPNLVDDGGMEGTLTDAWTQETNATMAVDTSEHSGAQEMKITAGAANVGATQAITLVSGKYYTVSGWARATSGDTAQIVMDKGDGTTITVGSVTATSYTRISRTFKATGTAGNIYLRAVANGDIVWFDDVAIIQLDQDDPSTTGTTTPSTSANSFGTGKWSDSNGAFLVDGGDSLTYPTSGNISASAGTIAFWMKPNGWNGDDGKMHYFFEHQTGSLANRITVVKHSDNKLKIKIYNSSGVEQADVNVAVNSTNFAANTWHHIAGTWNTNDVKLYLDGSSVGTPDTSATMPTSLATDMYLGSYNDGTYQSDGYFDDVRIYDTVLSAEEIRQQYNAASAPTGWLKRPKNIKLTP